MIPQGGMQQSIGSCKPCACQADKPVSPSQPRSPRSPARRHGSAASRLPCPARSLSVGRASQAEQYRERILAAVPEGASFRPLMTLYLTDKTPPEEVLHARGIYLLG